jgi:hypothetical protein
MATLTSDRKLYITADRSRVVEEGDVAAAFLLCGERSVIEADDVARYRLTHDGAGRIVLPEPKPAAVAKKPEVPPAAKNDPPPEDKMAGAPEDKAAPEKNVAPKAPRTRTRRKRADADTDTGGE